MRDFSVLSDREFEVLIADLLQAEHRTHVERFRSGPDGGIDLRWESAGRTTIVQCKHYAKSGFPSLYRALRNEVAKVEKLNPDMYRVATSVELTPANKEAILALFQRWMTGPSCILGGGDVDGLLGKHQQVEHRHIKLLFSSGAQLAAVLHADIANRTFALQQRILKAQSTYAVTDTHHVAQRLLDHHRVCVITGAPGVGKTTLAQMLIAQAMAGGYNPVDVSEDIREAFTLLRPGEKQIFFYDDFLGELSYGEHMGRKNEQKRLEHFVSHVSDSTTALLVMTTREYILHDAQRLSDPIARLSREPYLLKIDKPTKADAALILGNHIWHADLPDAAKNDLTSASRKKIAEHEGFNPRIVEGCMRKDFVADGRNYAKRFLSALDHPDEVWATSFNGLPEFDKYLLYVVSTLYGRSSTVDETRPILERLCHEIGERFSDSEFERALSVLDGTFTRVEMTIRKTYPDEYASATARSSGPVESVVREVHFINPSLRAYVLSRLASATTTCGAVLRTATSLNALELLWFGDEQGLQAGFRLPQPRLDARLRENFIRAADRITDAARDHYRTVLFWNCIPSQWRPDRAWLIRQMKTHVADLQSSDSNEIPSPHTYDLILNELSGTALGSRLHTFVDSRVDIEPMEDDLDEWDSLASHISRHRETCALFGSDEIVEAFDSVARAYLESGQLPEPRLTLKIARISSRLGPPPSGWPASGVLTSAPTTDTDERKQDAHQ